ncbi:hypothetical protein AAFF_G00052730 [Aldrovandia affinis]|uniref:IF rod domain-containing protein n=1 Tax=Aldrovandia affinis TaxID=143900 RepID=A0AAD7WZ89_9TELE|nr:hypothetical protein AAFF_G00052730 [Aldrovandia affinis]
MGFGAFSMEVGVAGGASSIAVTEKQTMQNLNDRLALYLDRVRSLEVANAKLEEQIRSWGLSHVKVTSHDVSGHQVTIDELRSKILAAAAANIEITLQIDNVKLAADDFKMNGSFCCSHRYENELGLRQYVEADIAGLKRMIGELTLVKGDLELQVEGVKEEIAYLKKNHEEETLSYRTQLGGQVQVEVDAGPAVDLNVVITEIRDQYEALVAKNRRDAEAWFKSKSEVVQQELQTSTVVLQTSSMELKDSQHSMRNLELELQAMISMKASLEGNLADTEARYSAQLVSLQAMVTSLEAQLVKLRADTERSAQEYQALLNIKTRLEMEIAEYRRLLEGGDTGYTAESSFIVESSGVDTTIGSIETGTTDDSTSVTVTKKVVTVVQEMVDGVVVSSSTSTSSSVIDQDAAGLTILAVEGDRSSPLPE